MSAKETSRTERNRLGEETSPYLLQHKDNPVHWWPWCPEALDHAKETNKPILLSVGYAACHWCHVMAHESFEDQATADVMNRLFVNIKVDREERPDIDTIYMTALHALGQQGGWPLTMFLLPDGRPFFGGTYFPKDRRYGRLTFVEVMERVIETMEAEPETILNNAEALTQRLAPQPSGDDAPPITMPMLQDLGGRLLNIMDEQLGGTRGAPKFPQVTLFNLIWRCGVGFQQELPKTVIERTLNRICQGGIYDHLGGGFARYSVDEVWLVPHFEKMLYDNAQLIEMMTDVWQDTQDPLLEVRVRETADWMLRDMVATGGGFAASYDADSEGEEGKFYVWSRAEILDALGAEDGAFFCEAYGVVERGNWEGTNILNRLAEDGLPSEADEARLAAMRERLLEIRKTREWPGWDDKVLADWNGLAIRALARASFVFDQERWLEAAQRAYAFVRDEMQIDGRLMHSARAGQLRAPATAADYANMISAAIALAQCAYGDADMRSRYLADAEAWVEVLQAHYWSPVAGGYLFTADDTKDVLVRTRSASDDAVPNANGTMVSNLAKLSLMTGEIKYADLGQSLVEAFGGDVARNLVAHTGVLTAVMDLTHPAQIVIAVPDEQAAGEIVAGNALVHVLRDTALPGAVIEIVADTTVDAYPGAFRDKRSKDGKTTAYVCIGPQCSLPITEPDVLKREIARARRLIQPRDFLS